MFTNSKLFETPDHNPGRRRFLQGSAGLVIALSLPFAKWARAQQTSGVVDPNAFIRIAPDNSITILIKHIEIGQGAFTGLATLAADEMDADWAQIRAEHAPANSELYKNFAFGIQGVGGSSGLANSYEQMRRAGASARAMLVLAAAQKWQVDAEQISVKQGVVSHPGGQSATFGDLANLAAEQAVPQQVKLKTADQFNLIGTDVPRLDTQEKSNGKAIFTQDIQMDGMLVAVVAHAPIFGATVTAFDASGTMKIKGVVDVKQIPTGVAVLATSTWAAIKGRNALEVNWDASSAETRSSDALFKQYKSVAQAPGNIAHTHGHLENEMSQASRSVEMVYEFPYLAHAPMETLDAVIRANVDGSVDVWMGSQLQTIDQGTIASVFSIEPQKVNLMTQLGGGTFGRRAQPDSGLAAEAAQIAKGVKKGTPVKLIWTREDDIQGGRYRPLTVHHMRAGLNTQSQITAWQQTIVSQSIMAGSPFEQMIENGIDPTSIEGAHNLPYTFASRQTSLHTMSSPVPVLWWRSVGHTHTAYAVETMLDYLLELAEQDPVEGRLALLQGAPRETRVLQAVARAAKAAGPVPQGSARGVAVHKSFGTYVAQIAQVKRSADGLPKVTKVWCAVDCGVAVNTNIIRAQMEGGIGFGLSALLREEVVLAEGGNVVQDNFDTYRPLRIADMPDVETIIIASDEKPTGVGEPGTPPIGPAVANAWRRLTGQMVTRLPFTVGMLGAQNPSAKEA